MMHYTLNDFNFNLPESQIAQKPLSQRDDSNLMILNKETGAVTHSKFSQIIKFLRKDDVLVLNNTRVIEARIKCHRSSGGALELLLIEKINNTEWKCITNRTSRLKLNEKLFADESNDIFFEIIKKDDGVFTVQANNKITDTILKKIGSIPLPPYIKRDSNEEDSNRYQTVYAKKGTSVAAPTAGLHFTENLINEIKLRGIDIETVNLTVSWGTFQPVRENDLSKHKMHSEFFELSKETASRLNAARKSGRRIIAVGTTSLRVLESCYENNSYLPQEGSTDIFLYPPCEIKSIDAIITNFHTPYSTLLMLVCSFGGYDKIMHAYKIAVKENYRFFSYGDSMFITGGEI
jgi:S-adenosylmethionine:tRNA ribosyltransferase-isomerase